MKRITIIMLLFFVVTITAQETTSFKQFYKMHKKEAEISLNIPGFLAKMFINNDDIEHEELIKKASNFKVMVFNNRKVATNFKHFAKKNKLKTLIRIKDGKERAEIYFKEQKNYIRELIISVKSNKSEFVLVGLKTKLTKEEFALIVSDANSKIAYK